jgi:hypothetical protein
LSQFSEVDDLRERVAALEAVQGRIVLSPQLLALLWGIALAVVAAASSAAVSAYQVRSLVASVDRTAARQDAHERKAIHPGARYEINDVLRRVSRLDGQPAREIPPEPEH